MEEAVFSNHASSKKKKRVLIDDNKTSKLSLIKSPKEQIAEALNASQYGALECTLPLTRSIRKSHKYQGIDPKLGYDWIAGILDTSSYISQCSDDYFDEMKEFRRANREECCRITSLVSVIQYFDVTYDYKLKDTSFRVFMDSQNILLLE